MTLARPGSDDRVAVDALRHTQLAQGIRRGVADGAANAAPERKVAAGRLEGIQSDCRAAVSKGIACLDIQPASCEAGCAERATTGLCGAEPRARTSAHELSKIQRIGKRALCAMVQALWWAVNVARSTAVASEGGRKEGCPAQGDAPHLTSSVIA